MKAIELITEERMEQIYKHKYTTPSDQVINTEGQLAYATRVLIQDGYEKEDRIAHLPFKWNMEIWTKMCKKSYKERLIIAGALIAAEIDRINE